MSLDPSFEQILDQTDPAPDSIAALQALLVVSSDGRIQFATGAGGSSDEVSFYGGFPLERLPEASTRWVYDGDLRGATVEFHRGPAGQASLLAIER